MPNLSCPEPAAAATEDASTFVSGEEEEYLRDIGRSIERKLAAEACKGFSHVKSTPLKTSAGPKPAERRKPAEEQDGLRDEKALARPEFFFDRNPVFIWS